MTKATPPKHIVLYADDDDDDLMLVQEAFANYASNVEVVTASDGSEALMYLENLSPHDPAPCLIILDVNMPRMNGKEALKEIRRRERFGEIPVALFTTSSLQLDKTFAEKYRASFITKPIDINQMAFIADQFVEHCTDEIKKNIQRRMGD
jgi:CheY-like chemotaxis protein